MYLPNVLAATVAKGSFSLAHDLFVTQSGYRVHMLPYMAGGVARDSPDS